MLNSQGWCGYGKPGKVVEFEWLFQAWRSHENLKKKKKKNESHGKWKYTMKTGADPHMVRIGTGPPFWQINHANSAYFRLFLGYFRVISATRPPLLDLGLPFLHMLDPPLWKEEKKKKKMAIPFNQLTHSNNKWTRHKIKVKVILCYLQSNHLTLFQSKSQTMWFYFITKFLIWLIKYANEKLIMMQTWIKHIIYRLLTAYLFLQVNCDKIMHVRWDFDASNAWTQRVSALDKHQN